MKRLVFILLLCYFKFTLPCKAQFNLVGNPGFEILTNAAQCPTTVSQMNYSYGWFSAANTPDYFNTCSNTSSTLVSIPKNKSGTQQPASGNAYAGFCAFLSSGYREYLETQLLQPLVKNTKYYLSMKVSLAEMWAVDFDFDTLYTSYLPCNKFGMKFTTKAQTIATSTNNFLMNNQAHLFAQNIVSDTTYWTTIQGSFVPDSNYTHLIIGNFFDNFNTNTINRPTGTISYLYLDNVIVSTDSTIIDYTLGATESREEDQKTILFPNPVDNLLNLRTKISTIYSSRIEITNTTGEIVFECDKWRDELELGHLSRGLYFLRIIEGNRVRLFKFVKE